MDVFYLMFLYFFIYSVFGWIIETLYCRVIDGKWTNRGFLFGPYCPIYGSGALLVIYFLEHFIDSPIKVFFLGMLFTTILEYLTSYVLEKMFNAKWWDYSQMKFNINGRVCLLNSLEFAALGMLLTYVIHPNVSTFILKFPNGLRQMISTFLIAIMSIDACSTVASLLNLKEKLALLDDFREKAKAKYPLPQKISDFYLYKELSELRKNLISKRNIQIERLLEAFPNFEFKGFKTQLDEFKLDLHLFKEELKAQRRERKANKKKKINN